MAERIRSNTNEGIGDGVRRPNVPETANYSQNAQHAHVYHVNCKPYSQTALLNADGYMRKPHFLEQIAKTWNVVNSQRLMQVQSGSEMFQMQRILTCIPIRKVAENLVAWAPELSHSHKFFRECDTLHVQKHTQQLAITQHDYMTPLLFDAHSSTVGDRDTSHQCPAAGTSCCWRKRGHPEFKTIATVVVVGTAEDDVVRHRIRATRRKHRRRLRGEREPQVWVSNDASKGGN